MDGATRYLIAVPQALADAARTAAATWDAPGADSMFRNPSTYLTDPANLYVFSYGRISGEHVAAIQAAMSASFPGGVMVAAHPFEAALAQAGLGMVQKSIT